MNEKHTVRDSARLKTTPSGPAYCRCGAPRVPTLNHLFLTEDLTKVPPRLKYDKSKYRSVHVDGRTYFLLQRCVYLSVMPYLRTISSLK